MRRLVLALITACLFAQPALAAGCYTIDAAKAEAMVRIHSKLMVIALTCKYAPDGSNLTDAYVNFGRVHNAELRQAENNLITYYRNNGKSGVAELDRLRTVLGNEYATEIAYADPHEFCKAAGTFVQQANYWTGAQFQQAVLQQASLQSTSGRMTICAAPPINTPAGMGNGSSGAYGVITNIKTGADAELPGR